MSVEAQILEEAVKPIKRRNRLTLKEKMFARKYVEHKGNGTKAALESYDTNPKSAHVIASRNLDKADIVNEIDRLLSKVNLSSDEYIAKNLIKSIDDGVGVKATNKDAITALNMLLKVKGSYAPSKSMKVSLSLKENSTQFSHSEVTAELKKLNETTQKLLSEK